MENNRRQRIQTVLKNRQRDILVVLEDIHDPHNAAAILRTCDALGIQNVWFIFEKEKSYNPKQVGKSSSSSANKWLDFQIFPSTAQCIEQLTHDRYNIIATSLTDTSTSLLDVSFSDEKIAVIVGNEQNGVSQQALTKADLLLNIPMMGFVQSLNVSVATAIILWEITKQRCKAKL